MGIEGWKLWCEGLCAQLGLDLVVERINLAGDGAVCALALLLSHVFRIVDCGIELVEPLLDVALKAGGQLGVLQGVADAGGARL